MSIIGPILGTLPMFYSFWEYIFNNNTINFKQGISYLIAAVGVLIINFNALKIVMMGNFTKQKMNRYWLGILNIIIYCFAVTFFILYNTSLEKTLPSDFDFTFQRLFGTGLYGLMGITLLLFMRKWGGNKDYIFPSINNIIKLSASIIGTAFLANYLFLVTKPDIDPVVYAGMVNLRPIFVIILGMLVLKEKIDRNMMIGMLIVAIGMGLSIYCSDTLINII
jgi:drug/metabolite transporter (DMT)-like permease